MYNNLIDLTLDPLGPIDDHDNKQEDAMYLLSGKKISLSTSTPRDLLTIGQLVYQVWALKFKVGK